MQELASLEWGMFWTFLIPEMLSRALTASPIKDDPDSQSMVLFIGYTHLHLVEFSAISMDVFSNT